MFILYHNSFGAIIDRWKKDHENHQFCVVSCLSHLDSHLLQYLFLQYLSLNLDHRVTFNIGVNVSYTKGRSLSNRNVILASPELTLM